MAKRRKFLIGVGSLAAGSAAAMGTGAFTSVSAERGFTVNTKGDSAAHLRLESEDSKNSSKYTANDDFGGDRKLTIDLNYGKSGGQGVNDDAYTVFRNLFKIRNMGTQEVYVWAEGLPENVRMFHDDMDIQNRGTGSGKNQGAFSDSSNLNPNDPADQNDPQNSGGYEAAPLVSVGEELNDIGVLVDTRNSQVDFDQDIVIKAVAKSEL